MSADHQTTPRTPEEQIGFGEAIQELESILAKIEGDEIDIDELAAQLKQATALLEICRSKVRKAEAEVTQIVAGLGGAEPAEVSEDEE